MATIRLNPDAINNRGTQPAGNATWWHLPAQFALVTGVMLIIVGIAVTLSVPIGLGALLAGLLAVLKCLR